VITPNLLLFAFSLLGLFLVPAALGRSVWVVPGAFAAVALFVLFAPPGLHPQTNPWIYLLLLQGPWVLLAVDLLARGAIARKLDAVPVRALLAFALFRFMGLRYVLSALTGDLDGSFALEAAAGEFFAALGALILWATWPTHRPPGRWYRGILVFWNTYALMTSLGLNFRILHSNPGLPWGANPSRELHTYFVTWPNALDAFFWIPLAIGVHGAVFYRLFREGRKNSALL
jgi:hypothetical protein